MNSCLSNNSPTETIRQEALARGASCVGFSQLHPIPQAVADSFADWLRSGCNATMTYLERYPDLRRDPRLLLDGANSIVVCAFNYYPATKRNPELPHIAYYAYGQDYHTVLRRRLQPVAETIKTLFPEAECRICIDTAPLLERYWAVEAGIGFVGRNSQLIVPGTGSYVLIGSIITTAPLIADQPCQLTCPPECNRCVRACPGQAIMANGHIDSRRCLSYLTIEHRGDFPPGTDTHNCLYGCDMCQKVCPFNSENTPTTIAEFDPDVRLLTLSAQQAAELTQQQFSSLFSRSAIKRAKSEGLHRNALNLIQQSK